jgi:hypothetical protein
MTDRAREIAHKALADAHGCEGGAYEMDGDGGGRKQFTVGHSDICDALTADIVAYGLSEREDAIRCINQRLIETAEVVEVTADRITRALRAGEI